MLLIKSEQPKGERPVQLAAGSEKSESRVTGRREKDLVELETPKGKKNRREAPGGPGETGPKEAS
ncbi:hypothetical protein, partial [Streptomyces yaizuensis]